MHNDAKINGLELCMKSDVLDAQTTFIENPSYLTAKKLLEVHPRSATIFIRNGETALPEEGWLPHIVAMREKHANQAPA